MIKKMMTIQTIIISIGFVLISIGIITYTRTIVERQNEEVLVANNKIYLNEVSLVLREKAVVIRQLGHHPTIRDYLLQQADPSLAMSGSYESVLTLLKAVRTSDQNLSLVWLASKRGNFFIGDGEQISAETYRFTERPWYKEAAFNRDEIHYSNPYIDSSSGQLTVSVIYPIFAGTQLIGVVSGDLLLTNLPSILAPYMKKSQQQTALIANNGTVIYHSKVKSLSGQSVNTVPQLAKVFTERQPYFHRDDQYYVMNEVNRNGWLLVTTVSDEAITKQLMDYSLRLFFAFLFVYSLLIFWTNRMLSKRLSCIPNILQKLRAIENGDYSAPLAVALDRDEITNMAVAINELSDRIHETMKEVNQLAYYDSLTGLPNRRYFYDQIARWMEENRSFAVIYIDLDNFKQVNDIRGHAFGDLLLQAVSTRLQHIVRQYGFIARLGGDEFVVLYERKVESLKLATLTNELQRMFRQPFYLQDQTLYCQFSGGVVCFPEDATDVEELVKLSDITMYEAKNAGKHHIQFFNEKINQQVLRQLTIEQELVADANSQPFNVVFQPQVNAKDGTLRGFEALVRWRSEALESDITPGEFIPLLEENGRINPMTELVFEEVCRLLCAIKEDAPHLKMAVNLSGQQLHDEQFVERMMSIVERYTVAPERIEIEITENMLLHSLDNAIEVLTRLRNAGFSVALDDFGSGFSSPNYLRRLPITTVKIDRSYIAEMFENDTFSSFIQMVMNFSTSGQFEVIAEGVETIEQCTQLEQLNCQWMQGYFFSPPVEFDYAVYLVRNECARDII